ncbi:MAG: exodeoxyribonuclease VII large subunit [Bacillota bacterium]|nr:exodeoxyribonuclease VII large subunit [Bacillota bacterium]
MLNRTQTVSEITRSISDLLDFDLSFKNLAIEGQISNLSKSSAGHWYFNLIDESALIKCVFFRGSAARNTVALQEGASLVVCGNLQVYKLGGYYQIIVTRVMESKESYMQKLFLELKNRLEKKGYFSPERKRPLPQRIQKIGLVTSKTSAAIKDFLTTLTARNPFIEVYLVDVRVQGKTAAEEISEAIRYLQNFEELDLIVVTRGGGSKDELFVFHDESICEAAFHSKIPVLSAVGHEIDKSLLDFTADIYCMTPTAAAQAVSDSFYLSVNALPFKMKALQSAVKNRFTHEKMRLDGALSRVESTLIGQLKQGKLQLSQYDRYLSEGVEKRVHQERSKLETLLKLLESYNVKNVLSRGFAILMKDDAAVVSAEQVAPADTLRVEMEDFVLTVKVLDVLRKEE